MPIDAQDTPAMSSAVTEVQGIFPSDDAMQDAIRRLMHAGFDRADLSLPQTAPPTRSATPNEGAENPTLVEDQAQLRTMGSSTAAASAAMVGAGVVVATGGAALVAGAAALGAAALAGGAVEGLHGAARKVEHDEREDAAKAGELVLAARIKDPSQQSQAEQLMRDAGATRTEGVRREDNQLEGLDSSSWTG